MKWMLVLSTVLLPATLNVAAQGKAGKAGPPSTPVGGHSNAHAGLHKSTNSKGKSRAAGLRKGKKNGLKKQNQTKKDRTKTRARSRQSASLGSGEEDRS